MRWACLTLPLPSPFKAHRVNQVGNSDDDWDRNQSMYWDFIVYFGLVVFCTSEYGKWRRKVTSYVLAHMKLIEYLRSCKRAMLSSEGTVIHQPGIHLSMTHIYILVVEKLNMWEKEEKHPCTPSVCDHMNSTKNYIVRNFYWHKILIPVTAWRKLQNITIRSNSWYFYIIRLLLRHIATFAMPAFIVISFTQQSTCLYNFLINCNIHTTCFIYPFSIFP